MKGLVMLLRQLFPDVDWEQLSGQIREAQTAVPAFAEALRGKVAEMDGRLGRIEAKLDRIAEAAPAAQARIAAGELGGELAKDGTVFDQAAAVAEVKPNGRG